MYGSVLFCGEVGHPKPPTSVVHQGTPEIEAATPSGTCARSSSNVEKMSEDHSTTPSRAAPAQTCRHHHSSQASEETIVRIRPKVRR